MEILKPTRSGLTPLPGLIEDLARLLHGVGYAPTSVELADLLWLAGYLERPRGSGIAGTHPQNHNSSKR